VAWPKGVPKDEATKRKIGDGVWRAWKDPERLLKRLEKSSADQRASDCERT
jgi:hypothetical protein